MSRLSPLLDRMLSLDPRVIDGAVALALTAWAIAEPQALGSAARAVVLVVMTGAVVWRRREPLLVLSVEVTGVALAPHALALPEVLAVLIAAYSAALYSPRRLIVPALLLVAAVCVAVLTRGGVPVPPGTLPFLLLVSVWLAGSAMRHRELRADASDERAERLEREREAALRAERARIARELHDVVTHSVSVMVLQTGAARQIMHRDEDRSQSLLASAEVSGRSALDELRRLLGLLSDDDTAAPLTPQPGVTEIPSLVEHVRHAGVPVELSVEGQARTLSTGVAIAAYRIVQEALTNVLKHADRAPTRVVVRYAETALELEIIDEGAPKPGPENGGPYGRGLPGMRERAAMYGGTLDARAEPGHGYAVRAHIPLRRPAS